MNELRIAVIGGGHLGTIHARLLQQVPGAKLVAIVEPDAARAAALASDFACPLVTDVLRLLSDMAVDAAVVAAPTSLHHDIGMVLLRRGVHLLVEKPLAATTAECKRLVAAAERAGCVLQVGHVERFNPAWTAATPRLGPPRFIDAVREGPLTFRSLDVGVVLDLMIHDIDLVLSLVGSPVRDVQAAGLCWTGPSEDVAQAQIGFANGCQAHLTASRVSCAATRRMRIHGDDYLAEIDFGQRAGFVVHRPSSQDWQSQAFSAAERTRLMERLFDDVLPRETLVVPECNPIQEELREFVEVIRSGGSPRVTGRDALAAVDAAQQVLFRVAQGRSPTAAQHAPIREAG